MKEVLGIYIHIPFCSIKCPYCDFLSINNQDENIHKYYIDTVIKELSIYISKFKYNIRTIYFGGGTPSLLNPIHIEKILNFIHKNFKLQENLEITIEANPDTYKYEELKFIGSIGINRLSIGNQTFNKIHLKNLGRSHNPQNTYKMIEDAIKSNIYNINLDLIYAIENQTLEDLKKDLEIYTSLPITHISAYMLTAYEDTPLGSMVLNGKYKLPDENLTTKMFYLIYDYLPEKKFNMYELSNWAKSGFECKHNILYWTDEYFLGVGVSSWSYINNIRFGNTKNLQKYLNYVNNNKFPVEFKEILTEEDKKIEKIMLGLRLKEGIDINVVNKDKAQHLYEAKLAIIKDNKMYLTKEGFMVINQIVQMLI